MLTTPIPARPTIFNFGAAPAFVTLVADYTPPGRLGASYGVSFFLSFGIGSFAATFAGFFADRWGTDSVFVVLAVAFTVWFTIGGILDIRFMYAALRKLTRDARDDGTVAQEDHLAR